MAKGNANKEFDLKIEEVFRKIIETAKNGEYREKQVELAKKIGNSIQSGHNFIGEGSTGIGKTFAYLVPSILSGKTVMVSTATKYLSTQIISKDLEFLSQIFPQIRFSELKGASNYFCISKAERMLDSYNSSISKAANQLDIGDGQYCEDGEKLNYNNYPDIVKLLGDKLDPKILTALWIMWSTMNTTKTYASKRQGAVRYISQTPHHLDSADESTLCAPSMSCLRVCPNAKNKLCPMQEAVERASDSHVLVTTHASVASWLRIGAEEENVGFLGYGKEKTRDIWIADEAHELEGILQNSWSGHISKISLDSLYKNLSEQVKAYKAPKDSPGINVKQYLNDIEELQKLLEVDLNAVLPSTMTSQIPIVAKKRSRKSATPRKSWEKNRYQRNEVFEEEIQNLPGEIDRSITNLLACIDRFQTELDETKGTEIEDAISSVLKRYIEDLMNIRERSEPENPKVKFYKSFEFDDVPQNSLNSYPLNIATELAYLKGNMQLIAISATMKVGGSFDGIATNLGFPQMRQEWDSFDAGSAFDYERQGIIYVPKPGDIPSPKEDRDAHLDAYLERTCQLIEATGGGALCLLTTKYEASKTARYLLENLNDSIRVYSFDETTDLEGLVEEFRGDVNSVLVGTRGFFQGLDLPGTTLRLVSINKIPFSPPTLISKRREEDLKKAGLNAFILASVTPAAQIMAQACGRLIRHTEDRGIVAVFDSRLRSTSYGSIILNSLPQFTRVADFDLALRSAGNLKV
jgi:Rad3-related DNA helicase